MEKVYQLDSVSKIIRRGVFDTMDLLPKNNRTEMIEIPESLYWAQSTHLPFRMVMKINNFETYEIDLQMGNLLSEEMWKRCVRDAQPRGKDQTQAFLLFALQNEEKIDSIISHQLKNCKIKSSTDYEQIIKILTGPRHEFSLMELPVKYWYLSKIRELITNDVDDQNFSNLVSECGPMAIQFIDWLSGCPYTLDRLQHLTEQYFIPPIGNLVYTFLVSPSKEEIKRFIMSSISSVHYQ